MSTQTLDIPVTSATEVTDLLRDLRRVAEMPADDVRRQAWLERKRGVLERIAPTVATT